MAYYFNVFTGNFDYYVVGSVAPSTSDLLLEDGTGFLLEDNTTILLEA